MYSSEHEREVLDANNALRWQVYDVYDGIRRVIDLEEDEKPRNEQVLLDSYQSQLQKLSHKIASDYRQGCLLVETRDEILDRCHDFADLYYREWRKLSSLLQIVTEIRRSVGENSDGSFPDDAACGYETFANRRHSAQRLAAATSFSCQPDVQSVFKAQTSPMIDPLSYWRQGGPLSPTASSFAW